MSLKQVIQFHKSEVPITEQVTKFGGQPAWIEEPEWPLSWQLGRPMRFICQIVLDAELFGNESEKMAYLFITDEEDENDYVDGTWEPDGGENAVIIQPAGNNPPTSPLMAGPTLYANTESSIYMQPCEFAVTLEKGSDENPAPDIFENKIGGVPVFLQNEEFPQGERWKLLLQLDSASVPFYINFGDAGVGYAFLSSDGSSGKFLWQCC